MRATLLSSAGLLLAAAACTGGQAGGREPIKVGAQAPAPWSTAGTGVVVGWTVRPEQLITCETAARLLRVIHARYGDRVEISLVTTDEDPAGVQAFLRRERLAGALTVTEVPEREFGARFGPTAIPTLSIVKGAKIVDHFAADRPALLDSSDARRLEQALMSLIPDAAVPEASSS